MNVISPEAEFLASALSELGPSRWLCPRYAFDIPISAEPESVRAFAESRSRSVAADINVLECANRRKRLLAADMESTIIDCECVDELAKLAGVGPQVAAITERTMLGDIPFADALRERVALLKGLPLSTLERVYRDHVRFNPGALSLVATMRAHGAVTLLVSGGFSYFTLRVAEFAGFDSQRANVLFDDGERLLGTVKEPVRGPEAKSKALEELAVERNIPLADTLAVGDGANDVGMIVRAGLGVAWHAKPVLARHARALIVHADLSALLYLQGYREDEIVRPRESVFQ